MDRFYAAAAVAAERLSHPHAALGIELDVLPSPSSASSGQLGGRNHFKHAISSVGGDDDDDDDDDDDEGMDNSVTAPLL
jgi:hypothetical protein